MPLLSRWLCLVYAMNAVRVVVVTMFEPSDGPAGELSVIRAREGLRPVSLPGFLDGTVFRSPDGALLAIVAGVGTGNTAVSIMGLGLASGLDLSKAWWLVVGIAGGNPLACSLGSPIWADWCVDGDLAFELDPRDLPSDWPCGILPLGAREPFGASTMPPELFGLLYQRFRLPTRPLEQAYALTEALALSDSRELATARTGYAGPGAKAPQVAIGGTLAAARFWHGQRHNHWAEKWVAHWTDGQARFFTSGMEDSGTLQALKKLAQLGQADASRVLILRTVSNYTMPPPGGDLLASLTNEGQGGEFPGHTAALENAYRAASTVYKAILAGGKAWD